MYDRRKKATHIKCFMLRLNNAIKQIKLSKYKNALSSVSNSMQNFYILDLEDFIQVFDRLLMESGEKYDIVY